MFRNIKCPKCEGSVRKLDTGSYYCGNCGLTFTPDENDASPFGKPGVSNGENMKYLKPAVIAVLMFAAGIALLVLILSSEGTGTATHTTRNVMTYRTYDNEELRQQVEMYISARRMEESLQAQTESWTAPEGAEYVSDPQQILSDSDFTADISDQFRSILSDPSDIGSADVEISQWELQGEPEYVTSYLMHREAEDTEHCRIVNIYRMTVAVTPEEGESMSFVLYDAVAAVDPVVETDGSISVCGPVGRVPILHEVEEGSGIYVHGYTDMQELLDACVTGASGYTVLSSTCSRRMRRPEPERRQVIFSPDPAGLGGSVKAFFLYIIKNNY